MPLVYGATAWGWNALAPSWGYNYGYVYSNPYYIAPAVVTTPVYDYSQPIVINTYYEATADAASEQTTDESAAVQTGYQVFDQAREAFKGGDYSRALQLDEAAIQDVPKDPALHEFGALCLFALGDYSRAAAVLNALLAVAPGMDWTTMSNTYGDVDDYTAQLRKLEEYSKQNPDDAAPHFVLAYHYLVSGHGDAAAKQLKWVTAKQPDDAVATRMLEALTEPEDAADETAEQLPAPADPQPDATPDTPGDSESSATDEPPATDEPGEYTDLVGKWLATHDEDRFGLEIGEDSKFTWAAIPKGQERVTITGQVATTGDSLILESPDQGTMVGRVKSGGPDKFQFILAGGPPDDEGLTFERVKE